MAVIGGQCSDGTDPPISDIVSDVPTVDKAGRPVSAPVHSGMALPHLVVTPLDTLHGEVVSLIRNIHMR